MQAFDVVAELVIGGALWLAMLVGIVLLLRRRRDLTAGQAEPEEPARVPAAALPMTLARRRRDDSEDDDAERGGRSGATLSDPRD